MVGTPRTIAISPRLARRGIDVPAGVPSTDLVVRRKGDTGRADDPLPALERRANDRDAIAKVVTGVCTKALPRRLHEKVACSREASADDNPLRRENLHQRCEPETDELSRRSECISRRSVPTVGGAHHFARR